MIRKKSGKQAVALEVDASHLDLCLALAELGAGLVEAGADAAVVEGGGDIAFNRNYLDQHPGEYTFDLWPYFNTVQ